MTHAILPIHYLSTTIIHGLLLFGNLTYAFSDNKTLRNRANLILTALRMVFEKSNDTLADFTAIALL